MAFWGVEVKPGKPYTHKVSDAAKRLHLSQATLGIGTAAQKSIVQCNVGNKSPVFLCSLFPEKAESCQLNIEFEEASEVVFSVIGPRSVHLTGYYLGGSQHYVVNDDESESYGEDIADTETERSGDDDEYDDDSFIDDSEPEIDQDSPVSDDELSIKEIKDGKKAKNGKGSNRRLRRKYQVSDSDEDKNWQLGVFAGSDDAIEVLDSESEDSLSSKDTKLKEKGKSNLETGESGSEGEKTSEREAHNDVKEKEQEQSTEDKLQQIEVEGEEAEGDGDLKINYKGRNATLKKKQKELAKKKKPDVSVIDKAQQEDEKAENEVNGAQARNECVRDGAKPKKRKKEQVKEDKPSAVECGTHGDALHSNANGDRKFQDLSGKNEMNEKQAVDKDTLLPTGGKKKRKKKEDKHERSLGVSSGIEGQEDQKQADGKNLEKEADQFSDTFPHLDKKRKKEEDKIQEAGDTPKSENPLQFLKENSKHEMKVKDSNASDTAPQVRTLANGLIIEELETGKSKGKAAAPGKKVGITYTARLKENGEVLDSNVGKSPLKFRLGGEKVIEGLNIGIDGMRVGGKRRLTIPPSLSHESEGQCQNVPTNSWLVYDVEVVKIG